MRRASPPAYAGFSLVEVALSLAILSVGMTAVLSILPVGLESARQVQAETVAAGVIRRIVGDFSTNQRADLFAALDLMQPGESQPGLTRYFDVDGNAAALTNAYFLATLTRAREQTNQPSLRFFVNLSWPAAAEAVNTNSPLIQRRSFVVDLVRSP